MCYDTEDSYRYGYDDFAEMDREEKGSEWVKEKEDNQRGIYSPALTATFSDVHWKALIKELKCSHAGPPTGQKLNSFHNDATLVPH